MLGILLHIVPGSGAGASRTTIVEFAEAVMRMHRCHHAMIMDTKSRMRLITRAGCLLFRRLMSLYFKAGVSEGCQQSLLNYSLDPVWS